MIPDRSSLDHLAELIARGDESAFERLFHAYRDPLCRYICAFTKSWEQAEDLIGEVFLSLWRQREKLGSVRDLHAYLYTTARFSALDHLRHAKVEQRWQAEQRQGAGGGAVAEDRGSSFEHRLLAEEVAAALVRAIDALPNRQRDILRRRLDGQSYQVIASTLGISLKTVEVHVTRAIAQLRKVLPRLFD